MQEPLIKFWEFLKKDTWQSWIVSLILVIIIIKLIIFPFLSFISGSPLPLVVVESCSMYHPSSFESWWAGNYAKYEGFEIDKTNFSNYIFKNGINKGDIIFVSKRQKFNTGDVIIFLANTKNPIIHRLISDNPLQTEGDNNPTQLEVEKNISEDNVLGKAVGKIPLAGWIKLIFFEFSKPSDERGFCK